MSGVGCDHVSGVAELNPVGCAELESSGVSEVMGSSVPLRVETSAAITAGEEDSSRALARPELALAELIRRLVWRP
jgi:hypothetical protein